MAGAGQRQAAARPTRSFDLDLREVGTLDAAYPSNIPWPTLSAGDLLLIGFDATPYGGRLVGYGSHGDVVMQRARPDSLSTPPNLASARRGVGTWGASGAPRWPTTAEEPSPGNLVRGKVGAVVAVGCGRDGRDRRLVAAGKITSAQMARRHDPTRDLTRTTSPGSSTENVVTA